MPRTGLDVPWTSGLLDPKAEASALTVQVSPFALEMCLLAALCGESPAQCRGKDMVEVQLERSKTLCKF